MGQFIYGKPSTNNAAGPTTILPSDLANLIGWYRADAITGLSDADPVGTWSDESGASNDLTSTGANRPTYKTNIQNTLPAVRFDGTDDWMDVGTGAVSTTTAGTVIIAHIPRESGDGILWSTSDAAAGNKTCQVRHGSSVAGKINIHFNNGDGGTENSIRADTTTMATGAPYITAVTCSGTAYAVSLNGASQSLVSVIGTNDGDWWGDIAGRDNWILGCIDYLPGQAAFAQDDYLEVIIYEDQKTGTDLTDLILYLNQKWQIY